MKAAYKVTAKHSIEWFGRRYDRANPESADLPNQAINHASSAVEGAALSSRFMRLALFLN